MIAFLINPFPYVVFVDLECIGNMAHDICDQNSVLLVLRSLDKGESEYFPSFSKQMTSGFSIFIPDLGSQMRLGRH